MLKNHDLNQVTWEQRVMNGDPKFEASQDIPDFPYAEYAELLGLRGITVEKPGQIAPAWDKALHADRPVVIDALCDPDVPPLPPHITFEQARGLHVGPDQGRPERDGNHRPVRQTDAPVPCRQGTVITFAGARHRAEERDVEQYASG